MALATTAARKSTEPEDRTEADERKGRPARATRGASRRVAAAGHEATLVLVARPHGDRHRHLRTEPRHPFLDQLEGLGEGRLLADLGRMEGEAEATGRAGSEARLIGACRPARREPGARHEEGRLAVLGVL